MDSEESHFAWDPKPRHISASRPRSFISPSGLARIAIGGTMFYCDLTKVNDHVNADIWRGTPWPSGYATECIDTFENS